MSTTNDVTVKAYTMKELSALYGISPRAFKTWLEPHEDVIGKKKEAVLKANFKAAFFYTISHIRLYVR